mmetsp:Transcript_38334/g.120205  ORF Transcript_38334/g.120205 Transcript_38334/m.120205 type:complete len:211 (-) Transcript_38334:123-755(-)|eukprot:CAMPEP_0118853526 /NCGR_PEP_ID=MMETSP1163-20130328/2076_1 /TAXON_ID=124430 /ORGANISM="Phaeomonas parva, Strain CCMP2877" /LENGTH=210 /DNA_ID=CAMNT_0006786087 /DNA_START=180 /DNA_END=812 /DNA_ORIENTATION=-
MAAAAALAALAALLLGWLGWRVALLLGPRRRRRRDDPASVLAVLGSGGHTMEMLAILRGLDAARYGPLHFVVAETDESSEAKVRASKVRQPDAYHVIPRAREVGQSYASSVPSTLRAALASLRLVFALRPDLILCNGPGTCLPLCLGGALLRLLSKAELRLVFVESFCRTRTLSLTGRILYALRAADEFVVHWPELLERYPRARYIGQLF